MITFLLFVFEGVSVNKTYPRELGTRAYLTTPVSLGKRVFVVTFLVPAFALFVNDILERLFHAGPLSLGMVLTFPHFRHLYVNTLVSFPLVFLRTWRTSFWGWWFRVLLFHFLHRFRIL